MQRYGLETLVCNTEEEIGDSADEKEEQVEDISEGKRMRLVSRSSAEVKPW